MTREMTELAELRALVSGWRAAGETIALVPTMGALHVGHLALIEKAKTLANRVVVSIFVNPTQFGPNEDFARYPRPLEADLATLHVAEADAVWLPSVQTMYPQGLTADLHIEGFEDLDGAARPGHFDGVATVVARLFAQVTPDIAVFGEKDYQQLLLIKRLVNKLKMNINVVGMPVVRESDGLALSSRNRYLNEKERNAAPVLYRTLQKLAPKLKAGDEKASGLEEGRTTLEKAGFEVEYLELRDAETLQAFRQGRAGRLLAAVRLGNTRLIDNIALG